MDSVLRRRFLAGTEWFSDWVAVHLDTKPREMTSQEQELLKMIAGDLMDQIKRRPVAEAAKICPV